MRKSKFTVSPQLPFPKIRHEIPFDDAGVVIEAGLGLFQVNQVP